MTALALLLCWTMPTPGGYEPDSFNIYWKADDATGFCVQDSEAVLRVEACVGVEGLPELVCCWPVERPVPESGRWIGTVVTAVNVVGESDTEHGAVEVCP